MCWRVRFDPDEPEVDDVDDFFRGYTTSLVSNLITKNKVKYFENTNVEFVYFDSDQPTIGVRDAGGSPRLEIASGVFPLIQSVSHIFLSFSNVYNLPYSEKKISYRSAVELARKYSLKRQEPLVSYFVDVEGAPYFKHTQTLTHTTLVFLIFHELAHVVLGHWNKPNNFANDVLGATMRYSDFLYTRQAELDADELAAKLFLEWYDGQNISTDVYIIGPINFIRWTGYLNNMYFSLFNEWSETILAPERSREAYPVSNNEPQHQVNETVSDERFVHFLSTSRGYPTGTERARVFAAQMKPVSETLAKAINDNNKMINLFLAATEDPDLHTKLWNGDFDE